jgi:DNA-binding CsgD family transcriptional regulator
MPDVMAHGALDDLRLLEGQWSPRVALAGLPPLYRHGMATGLTAAGLPCTPLASLVDLAPLLRSLVPAWRDGAGRHGAACVVVVPAAQLGAVLDVAAALDPLDLEPVPEPPPLAIVCILDAAGVDSALEAIQAGATGVVTMDDELSVVVRVVRAAAGGMTLIPRQVAQGLCRQQPGPAPEVAPRERSWLRHLAGSGTVTSLARTSCVSEREMYRLLGNLYRHLGASNRTEALLLAERWGLLRENET